MVEVVVVQPATSDKLVEEAVCTISANSQYQETSVNAIDLYKSTTNDHSPSINNSGTDDLVPIDQHAVAVDDVINDDDNDDPSRDALHENFNDATLFHYATDGVHVTVGSAIEEDTIDTTIALMEGDPTPSHTQSQRESRAGKKSIDGAASLVSDQSVGSRSGYEGDDFSTTIPAEYLFPSQYSSTMMFYDPSAPDDYHHHQHRHHHGQRGISGQSPSSTRSGHRRSQLGTAESDDVLVSEPIVLRAPTVMPLPLANRPRINFYEDFFDEPRDNYVKHPNKRKKLLGIDGVRGGDILE